MNRRDFIALTGAAAVMPSAALAKSFEVPPAVDQFGNRLAIMRKVTLSTRAPNAYGLFVGTINRFEVPPEGLTLEWVDGAWQKVVTP